jgi:hypothetical protein
VPPIVGPPTTTPSPSSSGSPQPTAPPQYATLYSAVNSAVASFSSTVSSQCAGANYPTKIYEEFAPANANNIFVTLAGASPAAVTAAANNALAYAQAYKQHLGVRGFRISISYPMLTSNPANLPNSSFTTANYATYLSYYEQVIAGLRSMGLGVDVETNILFPQYIGSQYNYNGLTLPMLEAGVAETAQHVIDNLKPDHVNLANEPSTVAFNTGFGASVNSPTNWAAFISAIRSQINNTNAPATQIGAGSDDWESSAFFTSLLQSTTLDYYDVHIYPPDHLQDGIADLQLLKASGKPVVVTESWLDKEDASVDGTTGPIDSQIAYVRDAYSFWANTDAQYVTSLIQLARCTNVQDLDLAYPLQAFTYVDYNATTANYAYAQMLPAMNAGLKAAESSGSLTPTGHAIAQYDGL